MIKIIISSNNVVPLNSNMYEIFFINEQSARDWQQDVIDQLFKQYPRPTIAELDAILNEGNE